MKITFLKRLTVSAILISAFAVTSHAKPGEGGERDGKRPDRPKLSPEKRAKILKKFDDNNNSKLDEDERAKLREAMKARRGDGPGKKPCPKKGGPGGDDAT